MPHSVWTNPDISTFGAKKEKAIPRDPQIIVQKGYEWGVGNVLLSWVLCEKLVSIEKCHAVCFYF